MLRLRESAHRESMCESDAGKRELQNLATVVGVAVDALLYQVGLADYMINPTSTYRRRWREFDPFTNEDKEPR